VDVGHLDETDFPPHRSEAVHDRFGGVTSIPRRSRFLVLHTAVPMWPSSCSDAEMGEAGEGRRATGGRGDTRPELAEEILAFCRAHLSHFKCPRSVEFTDAMPRGENGKLYKKQLRDAYWANPPRARPRERRSPGGRPYQKRSRRSRPRRSTRT